MVNVWEVHSFLHLGRGSEAVDSQEMNYGDFFPPLQLRGRKRKQFNKTEQIGRNSFIYVHSNGNKLWKAVKNKKMPQDIKIHRETAKEKSHSLQKGVICDFIEYKSRVTNTW